MCFCREQCRKKRIIKKRIIKIKILKLTNIGASHSLLALRLDIVEQAERSFEDVFTEKIWVT